VHLGRLANSVHGLQQQQQQQQQQRQQQRLQWQQTNLFKESQVAQGGSMQ
jgi:hypothetical protein